MAKKEIICYETDASRLLGKAEKVLFPETVEEIQNIVRVSKNICPRGGGTGIMGGSIPKNSVVVDLSKMNKIIDFDKNRDSVIVEPGITIKELNEKLKVIGFEFPIQPLNPSSTIGGMTAINASDFRSMKYGKMKDWIEEIEFVNGRGELMKTSKTDLSDICGLEGITGIIVRIKLKIIKNIIRSISIFQTDSLKEALSISRRLRLENEVVSLTLLPKKISKMVNLKEKYHIIIEFNSDRGKIKWEEYEKIIKLETKANYSLIKKGYQNLEDYKLFFDKLNQFIFYLESNDIPYYIYLGTGSVTCFFRDNEKEKQDDIIKLAKKTGCKLDRYGIGIKRKYFLDDFEKKIIQRVKLRHDPFGKINPEKIIDFEPKIATGKHLMPLQKEEVEEIKPFLDGEEKTASEVLKEVQESEIKTEEKEEDSSKEILDLTEKKKTPEEKLGEFIEDIEEEETELRTKEFGKRTKVEIKKEYQDMVKKQIKDYEETFESELERERKKKVEEIARNIPKNIAGREEMKEKQEKTGKRTPEEQDLINKIMTGSYKKDKEKK